MAGITQRVTGPFRIYYADAGTDAPSFPSDIETAPTGFTAVGNQLISTDGITYDVAYSTTLTHVLAYADPVAETLSTLVRKLTFNVLDMSTDFWELVTGNTASSGEIDMEISPGDLPEHAFVIIGDGPAADKMMMLWYPRCSVKVSGSVPMKSGELAMMPIELTVLRDSTDGVGTYAVEQ